MATSARAVVFETPRPTTIAMGARHLAVDVHRADGAGPPQQLNDSSGLTSCGGCGGATATEPQIGVARATREHGALHLPPGGAPRLGGGQASAAGITTTAPPLMVAPRGEGHSPDWANAWGLGHRDPSAPGLVRSAGLRPSILVPPPPMDLPFGPEAPFPHSVPTVPPQSPSTPGTLVDPKPPPNLHRGDLEDWWKFHHAAWAAAKDFVKALLVDNGAKDCLITGVGFSWKWETEEQTQWKVVQRGASLLEVIASIGEGLVGVVTTLAPSKVGPPSRADMMPLGYNVGRYARVEFFKCKRVVLYLLVTVYTQGAPYCPPPYQFTTKVLAARSAWSCEDEPYREEAITYSTYLIDGKMPYDRQDAHRAVTAGLPESSAMAPMYR